MMRRIVGVVIGLVLALCIEGCRAPLPSGRATDFDPNDPKLFSPVPGKTTQRTQGTERTELGTPGKSAGRVLELAWSAPADLHPGDYFEVQASGDLVNWSFAWGPNGTNCVVPVGAPKQFFRVRRVSPCGAGQVKSEWATTR